MKISPQIYFGDVSLLSYNGKKQDKIILQKDSVIVFNITMLNITDIPTGVKNGHEIEIKIKGGFIKKETDEPLLIVESLSKSFTAPYLLTFAQRPATEQFINLISVACMSAVKNNIGMQSVLKKTFNLDNLILNEINVNEVREVVKRLLNISANN